MEDRLQEARDRLTRLERRMDLPTLQALSGEIEQEMAQPGFWENRAHAQGRAQVLERTKEALQALGQLAEALDEAETMWHLSQEEDDPAAWEEAEQMVAALERRLEQVTLQVFMSGPYDRGDCFLSLNAGAGGTDAQDWTEMLLRLYTRFAERQGYKVQLVDETPGEEAGLKSATLEIRGPFAYGTLRPETGVHRLVRISPFDSQHRRHTSFASVTVIPVVEEEELEISPDDLQLESFRAGGPGGQHMQKNETAVRITHLPTGITVACQSERSQNQNKLNALRMLKARLHVLMEQERTRKLEELTGELTDIEWGHQIRSYVLQPYQMVKDHRTELEVGNVQAVLDGDILPFIWAWLEQSESPEAA